MSTSAADSPSHATSDGTLERLATAWKAAKRYVLAGIVTGVTLVVVAKLVKAVSEQARAGTLRELLGLVGSLVEHLGMGFIVAAIAVLFYEWGAHIKDAVLITKGAIQVAGQLKDNVTDVAQSVQHLQEQTTAVTKITGSANRILNRLDEMSNPVVERALTATLEQALRGPTNRPIVEDLVKFVLSLKDLGEHGDWAREGYVCYLGALLHTATKNAHPLCKLSTQLQDEKGATAEWHVDVPSPAELTDIMLAEQMKLLPASGRYSVVSNAGSWQGGQLVKLHRESEIAVKKRGVKIRRIFAMADRHAHRLGVKRDEVKRMFKQHLAASQAWKSKSGSYGVKLLDSASLSVLDPRLREPAQSLLERHFGVFQRPGERHCVRVGVSSPNLADLKISGLAPGSEELTDFDDVWHALPELTVRQIDDAVDRWHTEHPGAG